MDARFDPVSIPVERKTDEIDVPPRSREEKKNRRVIADVPGIEAAVARSHVTAVM